MRFFGLFLRPFYFFALLIWAIFAYSASAADYATVVMDARTGEIVYARNQNKPLHPASLTKMMTLYIAFSELEAGRIRPESIVTISSNAASEPPSKMGLRAQQQIEFRYLLRAAAIKSANDAATAIGEAISGSERNFAAYMTQTAQALGMRNTRFQNANGLTASGHQSTAYDMAILGRHLIYDFPQYYGLFSRPYAETPIGNFKNSNHRFLSAYSGADGIKTGYTQAAGHNLVASARRGDKRVIVSMFGGQSSYQRSTQVGALMDLGFSKIPNKARVAALPRAKIQPPAKAVAAQNPAPKAAPSPTPEPVKVASLESPPQRSTAQANNIPIEPSSATSTTPIADKPVETNQTELAPPARQQTALPAANPPKVEQPTITAPPDSGRPDTQAPATPSEPGAHSIRLGTYPTRTQAEQAVITTALSEMENLSSATHQVVSVSFSGQTMYQPRFENISKETAESACSKIAARGESCTVF